jgi:hypothetical protein
MNIFGESFHPNIINQIKQRQKHYGSINRTPEELAYLNSKTGWVKLISSVDIEKRERDKASSVEDRLKLIGISNKYVGNRLAKEFILFNGTSTQNKEGVTQRENITNTDSAVNNFAYGLGGNEFGLRPMPGIISAEVKTLNRGSIKESTVRIKAFNRTQFQIIDVLYLRLGYPILLEWGHSMYYDNKGKFHNGSSNDWSIAYDFLEGNLKNYYDVLSKIEKNRINSDGNYDALLGKVKNYNWTFDRDGNYDITLSIISVGDVIESLQANTLGPSLQLDTTDPNTTQSYPTGSSQEVIQSSKFKHTLGNILATTQENIDKSAASNSMVTYKSKGSSKVDAVRVDWQNHGNEYYYRLGSFLKVLEDNIVYASNGQSIIKIDYDDANYVPYFPLQISADPRTCIVRKKVPLGTSTVDLFQGCEKYAFTIGEGTNKVTVGILMNVYINFQYILTKLDELKEPDTGKVPIISFLDSLCVAINESLGYKNNIQPVIDETTNTVVFIDETPIPNQKIIVSYLNANGYSDKLDNATGEVALFDVYGYRGGFNKELSTAGFIKDFSLSTTISPDLATIITVGATANGKVVGEDATAFSKWNAALKNRITETFTDNKLTTNVTGSSEPTVAELYKEAYIGYREYIQELSQYKWDENNINTYSDTLRNLLVAKTAYDSSKTNTDEASLSTGFLPINLSLTMEGLSGMKVYQQFLVDTSYLPSNYPVFFKFLIKTIVHKIEGNVWTTNLETMSATTNTFNTSGEENETPSETRAASRTSVNTSGTANTDAFNQKDNIKKAFDFFVEKGFTKTQSAGIVGNLLFESRLNPKITNSIGAYGIAQWLGDRKKRLFKKPNYDTLEVQLNFIWEELLSTEKNARIALKRTNTSADAAIVWDDKFERSEGTTLQQRVAFANDIFKKYS